MGSHYVVDIKPHGVVARHGVLLGLVGSFQYGEPRSRTGPRGLPLVRRLRGALHSQPCMPPLHQLSAFPLRPPRAWLAAGVHGSAVVTAVPSELLGCCLPRCGSLAGGCRVVGSLSVARLVRLATRSARRRGESCCNVPRRSRYSVGSCVAHSRWARAPCGVAQGSRLLPASTLAMAGGSRCNAASASRPHPVARELCGVPVPSLAGSPRRLLLRWRRWGSLGCLSGSPVPHVYYGGILLIYATLSLAMFCGPLKHRIVIGFLGSGARQSSAIAASEARERCARG